MTTSCQRILQTISVILSITTTDSPATTGAMGVSSLKAPPMRENVVKNRFFDWIYGTYKHYSEKVEGLWY